jgi:hypothetical protein
MAVGAVTSQVNFGDKLRSPKTNAESLCAHGDARIRVVTQPPIKAFKYPKVSGMGTVTAIYRCPSINKRI